jgi:hypothetical protein
MPGHGLLAGPWSAALGQRPGPLRHPPGANECSAEQHFDVGVDAPELVVGPADQRVMDRRIEAEQDLPAFAHE